MRALRSYEEQELLVPQRSRSRSRSRSGRRHCPDSAVDHVRLIQELYAAGLSSRTVVELMPYAADGRATQELLDRLSAERDRVEGRITELVGTRDRLDSVVTGAAKNLRTGRSCRVGPTG
ncbi:MerR family transcriptional regulator [Streptomyces tendae]|uniref:MerR family transcriptional regulator n=1 Tax=Streptomyces tendae TaxID=1932 RepID=UPI003718CE9E